MKHLSVLIDAENVDCSLWPQIAARIASFSARSDVRIFGDFSVNQRSAWVKLARSEGFDICMQQGHNNVCDIAITIAAMDLLQNRTVDAMCLVASDADYTPLVRRLGRSGIEVYGIGEAKTPATLRKACTAFTVLKKKAAPVAVPRAA